MSGLGWRQTEALRVLAGMCRHAQEPVLLDDVVAEISQRGDPNARRSLMTAIYRHSECACGGDVPYGWLNGHDLGGECPIPDLVEIRIDGCAGYVPLTVTMAEVDPTDPYTPWWSPPLAEVI